MDLTAEFYLQTVDTVFVDHALPKGEMMHRDKPVDLKAIRRVALMTVEGENDDISGVGQTQAAHDLCPNIPADKRVHYLQKGVGHYGVFNGSRFRARAQLVARTEVHLKALNQRPVKVSVVDTRSRWGSCSPHNRSIRYSWRMVMAPPAVLDYLAAHEVAHLVHADHSPAYWAVVHGLVGDHRPFRAWLKAHGQALHAVGR
jgi:hypothetical protein